MRHVVDVEIRCGASSTELPRRYGKAIKDCGGRYSRLTTAGRTVVMPLTRKTRPLADAIVRWHGAPGTGGPPGMVCVIIRAGFPMPAHVVVQSVDKLGYDPIGTALRGWTTGARRELILFPRRRPQPRETPREVKYRMKLAWQLEYMAHDLELEAGCAKLPERIEAAKSAATVIRQMAEQRRQFRLPE